MRGDDVKKFIKLLVALALILSVSACATPKKEEEKTKAETKEEIHIDDSPNMAYCDSDYRTDYANVFEFDSYEGQPYFAAAFLGYGDRMDFRNTYVAGVFNDLGDSAVEQVRHIDFEGDEWYLIVPRYSEDVEIKNLDTGEVYTVYEGKAFTVKCNLSDLHPNLEISTEQNYGAYMFSPQIGGDGKLITNADVYDITDYSVTVSYVQGE